MVDLSAFFKRFSKMIDLLLLSVTFTSALFWLYGEIPGVVFSFIFTLCGIIVWYTQRDLN